MRTLRRVSPRKPAGWQEAAPDGRVRANHQVLLSALIFISVHTEVTSAASQLTSLSDFTLCRHRLLGAAAAVTLWQVQRAETLLCVPPGV